MIKIKRAYEEASKDDGYRILVERLWPRGVTKARADLDLWLKDVSPSTELRKEFHHESEAWEDFKKRYWAELDDKTDDIDMLKQKAEKGIVTFVYSSRDMEHNAAVALKEYIEQHSTPTEKRRLQAIH